MITCVESPRGKLLSSDISVCEFASWLLSENLGMDRLDEVGCTVRWKHVNQSSKGIVLDIRRRISVLSSVGSDSGDVCIVEIFSAPTSVTVGDAQNGADSTETFR